MKRFAQLFAAMDATNKTNHKVAAMTHYFASEPPGDCAWAVFFLCGGKLRAPVRSSLLYSWALEAANVPQWLFDECYGAVGDFAETAALLLPEAAGTSDDRESLTEWIETRLVPLRGLPEDAQRDSILDSWNRLTAAERFVWNKLITGAFRVGVSKALVIRAVSAVSGVPGDVIAHRLMGDWTPSPTGWVELTAANSGDSAVSRPYPFCLAHPLQFEPATLGSPGDWLAEFKWDGIRSQLIRREGRSFLWSRGNELITERFPEIEALGATLPDGTVVDGELVGWAKDRVLPFADLQKRIGRTKLSKSILDRVPVTLLAFDVLEWQGRDIRSSPLRERRQILESLPVRLSPIVVGESWEDLVSAREKSRDLGSEGLMLKRLDSAYGVGREKGVWWKWKVNPYSVDAVLIYAQKGSGKRASLFTDYTFGVWDENKLVPFAKAYSGLKDEEIRQVDRFVRQNTIERFGPVATVRPELVFEIAFEGIQVSTRHKSGVAVRFPRMARWRTDKTAEYADSLDTVKALVGRG